MADITVWHQQQDDWRLHRPEFEAERLDPERATGPWHGHRWFAYDLLRWRAPDVLVELGTHYGPSFFAFCQAVKDGSLPTQLHAVDSWEGDPHAGRYGPDVKAVFDEIRTKAYADLPIHEHVGLFSAALDDFPDDSVDLIHIDGYHSYEAAQEDFTSWLPKLAANGVVLMHDVAPETGYGSADYWRELAAAHPSFAFPHSFGLGVVFPKGTEGFDYLFSAEFERWRDYYPELAYHFLHAVQVVDQARMIEARDAAIVDQAMLIDARDEAIRDQTTMIDERDAEIRSQARRIEDGAAAVDERDEVIRQLEAEIERLQQEATILREAVAASRRSPRTVVMRLARTIRNRVRRTRENSGAIRAIFDSDYYLLRNPDVAASGMDPLRHYLKYGAAEGRDPSPFFDASYYLRQNPDVASAGQEPLRHFLQYGAREGRDPSPAFSVKFYTRTYPDVVTAGVNPLVHYLTQGVGEGRFVGPQHRRRVLERDRHERHREHAGHRSIVAVAFDQPGSTTQVMPLSVLERVDADLVTLDLWDTLVARTRAADAAKLATARRQFLRHSAELASSLRSPWDLYALRVRVEADLAASREHEEYEFDEVLRLVLREAVPSLDADAVDRLAAADANREWNEEIDTTYPLNQLWALLQRLHARRGDVRLAVVSDFYVGAQRMRELLTHHGWPFPDVPIYVSCEREASKRLGGTIYRLVREETGVSADRHVHIGDNVHADRDMQLETGGKAAILGLTPTSLPAPGALAPETVEACWATLRTELGQLADLQAEFQSSDQLSRRALAAGVASAPLAVGLVTRAIEVALERGLDRIHYMSREGWFLAQVHAVVAPIVAAGIAEPPRAVHLALSRRSTFGPSLGGLSGDGLQRMWSMYGSQSPRALLVSIGADPVDYQAALERHGLAVDQVLPDVANDQRVRAFLDDPTVADSIGALLARRRELLLDYLRQETDLSVPAMVVVDVGWRGTIQDNLAHLLPETQIHGVYLGLFPFLNPQPANVSKEAVGFDGNAGDDFAFAEPPAAVERPWTPHVPSTVDYVRTADGVITPVHAQEVHASHLIDEFQRGTLSGAVRVAEFLVVNGFTVPMVAAQLKDDLRRYYERPDGGVADIWFGSEHDDTFGALNVTPFGKHRPNARWLSREGDRLWATSAVASRWEPGFEEWLPVLAIRELRRMLEETR